VDNQDTAGREERSRFPAAFAIGAVVVLRLLAGLLLLNRSIQPKRSVAAAKLPFGSYEQAYAERIHFQDLALSHANNFLNQEFTYVTGTVSNDDVKVIRALQVTVEFHDPFNQVILRQSDRLIEPTDQPLGPKQQRNFQVTIEQRLPAEWNQQYPSIRVTGLVLE
jgi:hypothetical protein